VITWPVISEASLRIAAASSWAALSSRAPKSHRVPESLYRAAVKRRRCERRLLDEPSSSDERHI